MDILRPYASKILLGIRSKIEVFTLMKKNYNLAGSRQSNMGYVTSFDQVSHPDKVKILL